MNDWAAWAGVIFVAVVLCELLRLGVLFIKIHFTQCSFEGQGATVVSSNPGHLVSVIMPAKDEEPFIEQSVRSVLGSDYSPLEVLLVDDRSNDGTRRIMERLAREDPRVKVVAITDLPSGWTGKTHAMFQAANRAAGSVLLFTDADVTFEPQTVSQSLGLLLADKLDILGLLPGFTKRRFTEDGVYTHMALAMSSIYPLYDVNDPGKRGALASGCFIMTTRQAYETIGTWERLRGEVTEDVAFSKVAKAAGLKLKVLRGGRMVQTRPFDGIAEVCRFWKRTFYGGLEKSIPKIFRLFTNFVALCTVCIMFVASGYSLALGDGTVAVTYLFILAGIAVVAVIAPFCVFIKLEQGHWIYGLTAPVGLAISAWVTFTALKAVLAEEGIHWRGALYK